MKVSLLLAVAALLQPGAEPGDAARRVLREVQQAAAGDSVEALRARWSARAWADSGDEEALFGLAVLARRVGEREKTLQLTAILLARRRSPDEYTAAAHLARGQLLTYTDLQAADSELVLAASISRGLGDRRGEATALISRANTRGRTAGFAAADSVLDRAAELLEPPDTVERANLACRRAEMMAVQGKPGAAANAELGVRLSAAGRDPRQLGICLNILARDVDRQSLGDSAARLFGLAADAFRQAGDRQNEAGALQWRASELVGLGEYGAGRRDALRAVSEGRQSSNSSAVAWASLELAQVALVIGDAPSAAMYSSQAESLFMRADDKWGLDGVRSVQGDLALIAGDLDRARSAFRDGLVRASQFDRTRAIAYHISLSLVARRMGDFDEARRELDLAAQTARDLGQKQLLEGLDYDYGVLALRNGDLRSAERDLSRFLTLGALQEGRRYPAQVSLAEVYARRGDVQKAGAVLRAAADSFDSWRGGLDDRALRLFAFNLRSSELDPHQGFAAVTAALASGGKVALALELAERRRARDLLDHMVRLEGLGPSAAAQSSRLDSLRHSAEGLARSSLATLVADSVTALVEYVTGGPDEPTTVFTASRGGLRAEVIAPDDSMDDEIERLGVVLATGADAHSLQRHLGSRLMQPAVADLPSAVHTLVIVPDGPLHHLPFDALVLGDGRFVVEAFTTAIDPSAAVAAELIARPARTGVSTLLAFGDPHLRGEIDSASSEALVYRDAFDHSGGLPRLPASAREARRAARYAEHGEVRLRDDASEAFLKRAPLREYDVLHFATHALVDETAATRSALALSPGLGEDGFVDPMELAALDLDADLVILSGCRTAGGMLVGGEGVEGLTAPLLQAGARSVVATTWRVGDTQAERFIGRFYDAIAAGAAVGDALRAAKLASLRSSESPSSWAAYTLVGNPLAKPALRPPPPDTRYWVAYLLFAAILALVYWQLRRPVCPKARRT